MKSAFSLNYYNIGFFFYSSRKKHNWWAHPNYYSPPKKITKFTLIILSYELTNRL